MSTEHPIALVTGASRGIGAATAKLLGQQGYSVCVNYRKNELAAQTVCEFINTHGGHAWSCAADVSTESGIADLFDNIDQHGLLSVLVNNAGMLFSQSKLCDMNYARFQSVFRINVVGVLECTRQAVLRMSKASGGRGGVIVNVSSAASRLGSANEYVDYAATKGAIDTFTLGLAQEEAVNGIRINAVRPGLIETDIHASGGEPGRVERLKSSVPMQRGGSAEEVAETIVWLVSEKASYVNGALLDVSGGR